MCIKCVHGLKKDYKNTQSVDFKGFYGCCLKNVHFNYDCDF